MRLLFDQNLSPRLVDALSDVYPGSVHVQTVGLGSATDVEVWEYARGNHLIIVTKDTDFHERSVILGAPPKVVWIRRGNCPTAAIGQILCRHNNDIRELASDNEASYLMLI